MRPRPQKIHGTGAGILGPATPYHACRQPRPELNPSVASEAQLDQQILTRPVFVPESRLPRGLICQPCACSDTYARSGLTANGYCLNNANSDGSKESGSTGLDTASTVAKPHPSIL